MSKKTVDQAPANLYELLPDQPVDISDAAFADIEESLARVDAMKRMAAESIVKAKERGLSVHTERFRVLLRKLVVMDNELKAEKERKITARLAADLDQLEFDLNQEVYEYGKEKAEDEEISENKIKARRHEIAAVLFGLVGSFVCLIGCIAYFILNMVTEDVPFEWVWVIADGVLCLIFVIIGLCCARASAVYKQLAAEEETEKLRMAEVRREQMAAEESDIAEIAYALERESQDAAEAPACKEGFLEKVKSMAKGKAGAEIQVEVNKKALIPAIATGAAVLALAAASKSKKKKKEAKKKKAPKLQGVIIDWQ